MIKHTVTMDYDDLTSLNAILTSLRVTIKEFPDSFQKTKFQQYVGEIEKILGIEPPPIPEANTAGWLVINYDPVGFSRRIECSGCHSREIVKFEESLPAVCPHCKAVMIGVE